MVYILVKSWIPNWHVQLTYMRMFRLSESWLGSSAAADGARIGGNDNETEYHLTTLEAGLTHILTGGLKSNDNTTENLSLESHSDNGLFGPVLSGDTTRVREFLTEECSAGDECPCAQQDELGRSGLHLAALRGDSFVLEAILSHLASPAGSACAACSKLVDSQDCQGQTALHCAGFKGHQNALLLLLHYNANMNLSDIEGNTALHLVSLAGSVSCVKALLYYAEHQSFPLAVNQRNSLGDTGLHMAFKWGYRDIADLLLSYGAECVGNHLGQTPYDVAFCSDMIRPNGHPPPSPQDEDNASTAATFVRNISVGEMSQSIMNLSISVVDGLVDLENSRSQANQSKESSIETVRIDSRDRDGMQNQRSEEMNEL